MEQNNKRYGLFTAIAMIIGICIGSGIFFKSDNVLVATGGSVALGAFVFALSAIAIVFGGLAMGQLASLTDKPGGIFTYFEQFASPRWACAFGWFQVFVYYPAITIVVSWVVGIYGSILFNIQASLEEQILIGLVFCALCFLYKGQIKSRWQGVGIPVLAFCGSLIILSGAVQNKLFPLYLALCAVVALLSQVYCCKRLP